MFNLFIKIFIILTVYASGNLFAMSAYKEDIELSKKSLLISGAPYDENIKSKGAMTLCFKKVHDNFGPIKYEYEHAALVFEMFLPRNPNDVDVCMIHYGGDPHCCLGKNMKPWIESLENTLIKVYRGVKKNAVTAEKQHRDAEYIRYASWILPNDNLIKGYALASNDEDEHERKPEIKDSYSCIDYVQRIMQAVGLSKVDFGVLWIHRADNLKRLVDEYIEPMPNYKHIQYKDVGLPIIKSEGEIKLAILKPTGIQEPKEGLFPSF